MKNSVGTGLPEYSFNTEQTVLIVGAGLAGCAIAKALADRGYTCEVFDQHYAAAASTSAIPAAVIRPAVSGDDFFKRYFDYAFELCCKSIAPAFFTQCGALEFTDKLHSASGYSSKRVTAEQASVLAGTELSGNAVYIEEAGYVAAGDLCNQWLQHDAITFTSATTIGDIRKTMHGWQLVSDSGEVIGESHIVVLATGAHSTSFELARELPLQYSAGQIDLFEYSGAPLKCIVNSNGYLLPYSVGPQNNVPRGVWCGATHHRHQTTCATTDADSQANKTTLADIAPSLSLAKKSAQSFSAVRTYTPDRLPVVGALHDSAQFKNDYADLRHGKPASHYGPPAFHQGLYLAAGLGSRGATQALLIGELISDLITGMHLEGSYPDDSSPHQQGLKTHQPIGRQQFLQTLHPARFLLRELKRSP